MFFRFACIRGQLLFNSGNYQFWQFWQSPHTIVPYKAYVLSFSEAIANELRLHGITVTCLCPGATATNFAARADMEKSRLFKMPKMSSRSVAMAGYKGMMRGKTLVVPGLLNKVLAQGVCLGPRKLVTSVARSVQERTR